MFQGTPMKVDVCISMEESRTCHVSTMAAELTGGVDNAPAVDIAEWCRGACHQLVCQYMLILLVV
jgi:hypothetical protein